MKKIMKKPVKNVKKAIYRGRVRKFKSIISFMLIGGILASVLYFGYSAYVQYAVSRAHILLSYPEIAQSQYPDGGRFTYYDFVSDERLAEALEVMHKNGKYENFGVEDIRDNFDVHSYLDASASNDVFTARYAGDDFSYVANEYKITFVQPHDYENPSFAQKIASPDYSDEFLRVLADINKKYISEERGGINGFNAVSKFGDTSAYDYDERIEIYNTKIKAVVAYIDYLESKAPKFVSKENNMTLKDVKGKYELLITNKIDSISDFIESSNISRNPEVAVNKIKVNLENNQLNYNKYMSKASITEYAMINYDQTFTENLINVVRDDIQGLYQARPKTAFDEVVTQMNESRENVAQYSENINNLNLDLARFSMISQAPVQPVVAGDGTVTEADPAVSDAEQQRLSQKCDELFAAVDKEYEELTVVASDVVRECLNKTNENYMTFEVKRNSIFTVSLATKLGIVFLCGAVLMFVVCIAFSILADSAELRRKQKMLRKMKKEEKGE